MTKNPIEIQTKDGTCPCYASRPSGAGPWPGVLVYMDGLGIRPAMLEIGERLATYGYFALLPDLFTVQVLTSRWTRACSGIRRSAAW